MKKLTVIAAVALALTGCDSNNPNKNPSPADPFPPAAELEKALYVSTIERPNCGVVGLPYNFHDADGQVLMQDDGEGNPVEFKYAEEGGKISLLEENIPVGAKYLTYHYAAKGTSHNRAEVTTFELAMLQDATKAVVHFTAVADMETPCSAIQGVEKTIQVKNTGFAERIALGANGVLANEDNALTLAEETPVLITGYDADGQLALVDHFSSLDLEDGQTQESDVPNAAVVTNVIDNSGSEILNFAWVKHPIATGFETQLNDGQANVVSTRAVGGEVMLTAEKARDSVGFTVQRVPVGTTAELEDLSQVALSVDFPDFRPIGTSIGGQMTDLSFSADNLDAQGSYAAHYAARYYTGSFMGQCRADWCGYIYRNVFAMTEAGEFYIPEIDYEAVNWEWMGGGLTRQSFVVSDQQTPAFINTLAGGATRGLTDALHWADLDDKGNGFDLPAPVVETIPASVISEAEFEARQRPFIALGEVNQVQ